MEEKTNFYVFPLTIDDVKTVQQIESKLIGITREEKVIETINSTTLKYFVLKINGEVVGFFECSIIAPEAELFDIAISETYQGRGYSKILMDYFLSHCKECGCNTIFLEVNSINHKAIKLYEKYGFVSYGIRKNYYGENDAILMKCEI